MLVRMKSRHVLKPLQSLPDGSFLTKIYAIGPRVIKRKMSRWAKKRVEHRRPPPLLKTFVEYVVMKT